MPLNRQAVVMARHGVPIDRSVLADCMGRTGALIAPVVEHMAKRLRTESTRLYVDETTAPVLDPGKGKTKTNYLWAVLRDVRGWGGTAPPGVVFHYRPGRKGEYAAEILNGFNGTIQVDACGGYPPSRYRRAFARKKETDVSTFVDPRFAGFFFPSKQTSRALGWLGRKMRFPFSELSDATIASA